MRKELTLAAHIFKAFFLKDCLDEADTHRFEATKHIRKARRILYVNVFFNQLEFLHIYSTKL